MLGAVANTVGGFALVWMAGRWLGAGTSGVVFAAVAAFTVLSNGAKLGADTAVIRFAATLVTAGREWALRPLLRTAVGPAGAVSLGLAAVLLVAAPVWSGLLYADRPAAEGVPYVVLMACALPVATVSLVLLALMRGLGSVTPFVGVEQVLKPVSRPLLLAGCLLLGGGGLAFWVSWLVPVGVGAVVAALVVARRLAAVPAAPDGAGPPVGAGEFWGFAGPRAVAGVLEICGPWIGVLFLSSMVDSPSAAAFTAVTRVAAAGGMVMLALRLAVSAHLAAAHATGDLARIGRLHVACTSVAVLASFPFFLLVAAYADPVLGLFGAGFAGGGTALVLVCGANLVNVAVGNAQSVVLMSGRSAWNLHSTTAALLTQVGIGVVAVPRLGVTGAGLAYAAGVLVDNLWAYGQVRYGLGVRIWTADVTVAVLGAVAASGAGIVAARLAGLGGVPAGLLAGCVAMSLVAALAWSRRRRLLVPELLTAFGGGRR